MGQHNTRWEGALEIYRYGEQAPQAHISQSGNRRIIGRTDPEVSDACGTGAIDEDIRSLQVTVSDALRMEVHDTGRSKEQARHHTLIDITPPHALTL